MSILWILLILVVAGIFMWAFTRIMNAPGLVISEPFKTIIWVIGVVLILLFVLQSLFGVLPGVPHLRP